MEYYKNPKLIYLNGKAYQPEDLQAMVDFYNQNINHQITFPTGWNNDVNAQIFKYYPFYSTISKSTYDPRLYYEQYCQLDITLKEFFEYIDNELPDEFNILIIKPSKYISFNIIATVKTDYNEYNSNNIDISRNGLDQKFFIGNKHDEIKYLVKNLQNEYQYFFDIKTIKRIYQRRIQCINYNDLYANEMTNKYINDFLDSVPNVDDQYTFIIYVSSYLFMLYNNKIDKSEDEKYIIEQNIENFINIEWNSNNKPVEYLINLIKDYDIHNL